MKREKILFVQKRAPKISFFGLLLVSFLSLNGLKTCFLVANIVLRNRQFYFGVVCIDFEEFL